MAVLDKSSLEAAKRNLIRSDGQGGLTKADNLRAFSQHVIDTIFALADDSKTSAGLKNVLDDLIKIERDLEDLKNLVNTFDTNFDFLEGKIENNSIGLQNLNNTIINVQNTLQSLYQKSISNQSLLTGLQDQIDALKNQKQSLFTWVDVVNLSQGENVIVHAFNLKNPDFWILSTKISGETVFIPSKTRDSNSIFLIPSQDVQQVSIFLTAKMTH